MSCYNLRINRDNTPKSPLRESGNITMLTQGYGVLFVLTICSFLLGVTLLVVATIVSPKAPNLLKNTPYESGMNAIGDARIQFDVKYYLYSLLFILFDIEAIFLFPWAVGFNSLGLLGLLEIIVFLAILFLGLVYAWRRKALEWQ